MIVSLPADGEAKIGLIYVNRFMISILDQPNGPRGLGRPNGEQRSFQQAHQRSPGHVLQAGVLLAPVPHTVLSELSEVFSL